MISFVLHLLVIPFKMMNEIILNILSYSSRIMAALGILDSDLSSQSIRVIPVAVSFTLLDIFK